MNSLAARTRQQAIITQTKARHISLTINFEGEEDVDMDVTPEEYVSYRLCIVCQEDLDISQSFGMLGFVQPSRLLRQKLDNHSYLNEFVVMLSDARLTHHVPPKSSSAFEHIHQLR